MQMHRVLFVVSEENYTVRYLRSSAQPNANILYLYLHHY